MEKSLVKTDSNHERDDCMAGFIPREKLSKKARKRLDSEHRVSWMFSPVSRKVESKKAYSRKRKTHDRYNDYGMGFPCITGFFYLIEMNYGRSTAERYFAGTAFVSQT